MFSHRYGNPTRHLRDTFLSIQGKHNPPIVWVPRQLQGTPGQTHHKRAATRTLSQIITPKLHTKDTFYATTGIPNLCRLSLRWRKHRTYFSTPPTPNGRAQAVARRCLDSQQVGIHYAPLNLVAVSDVSRLDLIGSINEFDVNGAGKEIS